MKNSTKIQLARYGILALAGLSAESAKAGVVTSGSNFAPVTIGLGESKSIDFGGGVGSPFRFAGLVTASFPSVGSFVVQKGFQGVNQQILSLVGNDPARLAANYVIGPGRPFVAVAPNGEGNDIAGFSAGNWNGAGTVSGFLGIRFESPALNPGVHYGYFDISYNNSPSSDNGTLIIRGWAYETNAGQAITTPSATAAPEPSSLMLAGLGMLSCGAAGLRSLRAQKKTAASPSPLDA